MPRAVLTDKELIAHHIAGTLLDTLHTERNSDRPDSLRNRLIALHNGGHIDLLAAIGTSAFDALAGPNFFSVQRIYCEAIPQLRAPPPSMMEAVVKLVEKGGRDLAASFPYNAFKQWLDMDKTRAEGIIASADAGNVVDKQFIAIALEALGNASDAEWFIAKGPGDLRLAGLSALGRIKPTDDLAAEVAVAIFLPFCNGTFDGETRFAAINAAFALLRNTPTLAIEVVPKIVAAVEAKPTIDCLFAVMQALWLQENLFGRTGVEAVLKLARNADFTRQGFVDVLDGALQHMLGTPERDLALDFLTDALAVENGLSLKALDGVSHVMANETRLAQFPVAVRWFATANRHLCEAIAQVLTSGRERDEPFDASMAGMAIVGKALVAVCHKAIGFLLLHPAISASVVVAALRTGDVTAEAELTELLVYPILINFGGPAKDYLVGIKKGDGAYKAVKKALKKYDGYANGANIEVPIKELWPSDRQRHLATMKGYDLGREIRKRVDEQSIFSKLVHRSTLLYGHKSMSFVGGPDKPPVTMELKEMGVEMPMPRMDLVDPVGLDWLMRVFRNRTP